MSTALPKLEEAGFYSEKWEEDDISKWTAKNIKTQWRTTVVNTIYSHCGADTLNTSKETLPTMDSNQLEINLLKEKMKELQVAAKYGIEEISTLRMNSPKSSKTL